MAPIGINNGNSYFAQRVREDLDEAFWEDVKKNDEAKLRALHEEAHAVYCELIEVDPEGGEAWYDDDENVPAVGSTRERIRLVRARIEELRARKGGSGGKK